MTAEAPSVGLHGIRLGDRGRTGLGWLVVSGGALRGILTAGRDGEIVHAFACDRRIMPVGAGGIMIFRDLDEALAWMARRLPSSPPARRARRRPPREEPDLPTPLNRADAEQRLLGAAVDYCWTLRHHHLPDDGPQRRLWDAYVAYRRVTRLETASTGLGKA